MTAHSSTPAKSRTYLAQDVADGLNQAADDIFDAVNAGDSGLRDALNLMVNATMAYLRGQADDLRQVVEANYSAPHDDVRSWTSEATS
ncbi:hypothetical protein [Phytohabitans houttuyneae]|uniref:Uncharacterized protein n=1 Tax=Phytohabitans houttuyneae TaxID=1076126 RepID=A0A6V8K651_9ACTN|nr:hypothetical protein [Phytohabitans houttuyneae]GFJ77466.1 hypothetical protein Phou_016460 [Phytohabitans houttuyneae]